MNKATTLILTVVIALTMIGLPLFSTEITYVPDEPPAPITTAEDFITALSNAGYPLVDVIVFTEVTDPNHLLGRPGNYVSKANFEISTATNYEDNKIAASYDNDYTPPNTIEQFATVEDAEARLEHIEQAFAAMPIIANQYVYHNETWLLRIDFGVLPADAQKYEAALDDIVSGRPVTPFE